MRPGASNAIAVGVAIVGIAALAMLSARPEGAGIGTEVSSLPSATTPAASEPPGRSLRVGTPSPSDAASLAAALAEHDITMAPVDATDEALITPDQALGVARETYTLGTPTVSLARLTVGGYHVGDPTTPLVIEDRLVYAVQLAGLDLRPFGGDVSTATTHHEVVVFVDATTGEMLQATTVR
jgi:hypothetical protein